MTLEETVLCSKLTVRTFTADPPRTASYPDSKSPQPSLKHMLTSQILSETCCVMCFRFDGLYSVSYHFTDGGETESSN